MTLRYTHLSPEHKKKAVELLAKNSIIYDKNLDAECKKLRDDVLESSNILVTSTKTENSEFSVSLEPSKD